MLLYSANLWYILNYKNGVLCYIITVNCSVWISIFFGRGGCCLQHELVLKTFCSTSPHTSAVQLRSPNHFIVKGTIALHSQCLLLPQLKVRQPLMTSDVADETCRVEPSGIHPFWMLEHRWNANQRSRCFKCWILSMQL